MAITGSTTTIFVPRDKKPPKPVEPGKNYFLVKIHSAQATFTARFFERVNNLIVASSVSLNHPVLGTDPIKALQFSRKVKRNTPKKLGVGKNLINLVPAIMKNVSISIDYILDKENRMANLSKLINAGAFVTSLTFGPGAAATAKAVSGISQKLIDTFIPEPKQREPILQFREDFSIPSKELKDGFYVILSTDDPEKPLPDASSTFEVKRYDLFVDGKKAVDWSYVIFKVYSEDARTRDLNEGAAWEKKLREAEEIADLTELDEPTTEKEKNEAWAKCHALIKEAATLLGNDDNYLRYEAVKIYRCVGEDCRKKIFGKKAKLLKASRVAEATEIMEDEEFLGVKVPVALKGYKREVKKTQRLIKKEKLL